MSLNPWLVHFLYISIGSKPNYDLPTTFHVKPMAIKNSLQNINWLPTTKNVSTYPVFIREKIYIVPVPRPFPYNAFVHILEGQVHKKESKLQIVTDLGKKPSLQIFTKWVMHAQTALVVTYNDWFITQCMRTNLLLF